MGDTDGVLGAGRGDCDADIIIGLINEIALSLINFGSFIN